MFPAIEVVSCGAGLLGVKVKVSSFVHGALTLSFGATRLNVLPMMNPETVAT